MGIFDSSNMKKALNTDLFDIDREKAVGKIKDKMMLAQLAKDDPDADVRLAACKMVNNRKLWARVARDATDFRVRLAACKMVNNRKLWAQLARDAADAKESRRVFSEAIDQLTDDRELCHKAIHDSLVQIEKHESDYETSKALDILMRIAAHNPRLICQSWTQVKSACHEDDPKSCHRDVDMGRSGDCSHWDDYSADPHHRDRPNSELLQDFPAAARSLVC
jgi:hypothetical protein